MPSPWTWSHLAGFFSFIRLSGSIRKILAHISSIVFFPFCWNHIPPLFYHCTFTSATWLFFDCISAHTTLPKPISIRIKEENHVKLYCNDETTKLFLLSLLNLPYADFSLHISKARVSFVKFSVKIRRKTHRSIF